VPGNANEYMRSQGWEWSPFGGVKMAFAGLDAAFRGMNIDDERPDFLVLDDPETRDSAKSLMQIEDRIDTIEKDIEGLEGQDRPMGDGHDYDAAEQLLCLGSVHRSRTKACMGGRAVRLD
jgi:hypothetical protein